MKTERQVKQELKDAKRLNKDFSRSESEAWCSGWQAALEWVLE